MANKMVSKDERTTFIENVSYKFGYNFIAFALLIDVMYRGVRNNESSWDLLAIIITSGLVMTAYQYRQKILEKTWLKSVALIFVIALIIAFLFAFVMKKI